MTKKTATGTTSIADLTQRQRALDPKQSFIVEAPAGSGKTELLTQRFLTLLARCNKPEEILAITFTRKAAAEMRHRVLSALQLAQGAKPEKPHAQHTWELAQAVLKRDAELQWSIQLTPQRLQIFTFDSLCSRIAKALPLHSHLGASIIVSDDTEALYQRTVDQLLSLIDSDSPIQADLCALLAHRDNNYEDLRSLFIGMLKNRDAWLPLLGTQDIGDEQQHVLQHNLENLITDSLRHISRSIALDIQIELGELARFAAQNFHADYPEKPNPYAVWLEADSLTTLNSELNALAHWKAVTELTLTGTGTWRKSLSKTQGFPAGKGKNEDYKNRLKTLISTLQEQDGILEQLCTLRTLPSAQYSAQQALILQSLTRVLPRLVAQFKLVCAEQGAVDFTEISQAALTALGHDDDASDLALRLDYRIQHILVDEFQDTSTSQTLMLEKLVRGWQADDGRTLFCVGDAMQSIYSFRNARVSLFLACKQQGLGNIELENLQLSANFRSQKKLVDWNNSVFSTVFPPQNDIEKAAVAYAIAEPVLDAAEDPVGVYTWNIARPEQEANKLVELIQSERAKNANVSIAILLRKKAHATHLLPALQNANLLYQAVELAPLANTSIVQDLLALTRALLNTNDRISWLAILRAPWCGARLCELEAVATTTVPGYENQTPALIEQLAHYLHTNGAKHLQRVHHCLEQALNNRQRLTLHQWVEGVWFSLGGAALIQREEDQLNADAFFRELATFDNTSNNTVTIASIERAIDGLFAAPNPQADGSLQIMSIHKSKGLEFDVVILPSLHASQSATDNDLLQWQDRIRENGTQEILLAPVKAVAENTQDELFDYLKAQKKQRARFEDSRLLYVACTRAKQRLYLLGALKPDKQNPSNFIPPVAHSFLGQLAPHISQHFHLPLAAEGETGEGDIQAQHLQRLDQHWQAPVLDNFTRLPHLIQRYAFGEDEQAIDLSWQDKSLQLIGTLTHAILCEMHRRGLGVWQQRLQQDKTLLISTWKNALFELAMPASSVEMGANKIWELLNSCIQQDAFLWLFDPSHKLRLSEYPISHAKRQNLVVDLVIVDSSGQLWIIDYKTSQPSPDQDLQAFLNAEVARYRDKMEAYRQAVNALDGVFTGERNTEKSAKAALYFPLVGKRVEI